MNLPSVATPCWPSLLGISRRFLIGIVRCFCCPDAEVACVEREAHPANSTAEIVISSCFICLQLSVSGTFFSAVFEEQCSDIGVFRTSYPI